LLATTLISLMAFGSAEQSPGLLVMAVAGAVAGWWITERRGKGAWAGLPRWFSTMILVLMLIGATTKALQGQREVVSAFEGFLASIIVVKLWERRELRDYSQILTMSLFLTVGATLNNNSLLVGVLLLVQVPVFVVAVMLFQLYAAGERVRMASWNGGAARESSPLAWSQVRRAFTMMSLVSVLVGAAISIGVFLLVPRGIGLQEWGQFGRPRASATGFTEDVEPGANQVISGSPVAMMEVKFSDGDGRPLGGPEQSFYLRGSVLDRYDAVRGRWTKSGLADPTRYRSKPVDSWQELRLAEHPPKGTPITQSITELTGIQGDTPVFALYQPVILNLKRVEQSQEISYDTQSGWVVRRGDGFRASYEVTSIIDPATPDVNERGESVGFPSKEIRELASGLLRQSGYDPDPAKRPIIEDGRASRALENYLRNNYDYTLSPGPVPLGQSPTEYFLFISKRGHCEYFASALAAMCRSVGIEARVVAGYLVTEYHSDRESYTVRASDAHAWVEINTGPGGWQRRDATPADSLRSLQSSRRSFWARMQRIGAAIQDLWNSAVVTFDQNAQDRLLGRMSERTDRSAAERAARSVWRTIERAVAPRQGPAALAARVMLAGAVFLACGMVWVLGRAVRRRSIAGAAPEGQALAGPERRVYRELLAFLASRGHAKPAWLPPMVHLRSLGAADAALAGGAAAVVSHLYRSRFGGGGAGELAAARETLHRLKTLTPARKGRA
jgi:transglutaminase-like putative cysteine protease